MSDNVEMIQLAELGKEGRGSFIHDKSVTVKRQRT